MSRFLLLNFEDFELNQDITKTIQSHTSFCVCCLQTNVPLVNLANCSHSNFLDVYYRPEFKRRHNYVACQQCHAVLMKINQFKEKVENSLHILQDMSFNIADQGIKTSLNSLNIHKTVDILLSPTSANEVLLNESKSESTIEDTVKLSDNNRTNEEADAKYTKKLKNIQKALEIINNNQSDLNLAVLNTGLQCLKASNFGDISKTLDTMKGSKNGDQSSQQLNTEVEEVSIKVENVESDDVDNGTNPISIKAEEITEKVTRKEKHEDKATQICIYIKTVTLSKEELMQERCLKTQSLDYLKHQYKCEHCIIGFNYKDNLDDHIQRKHTPKLDSITCDLCLQILHPTVNFYAHKSSHYIRYECIRCKKRYSEYGDAIKHYRKQHGLRRIQSKCRFCDYSTDSKTKLKVHMQKYHNKFPCDLCGVPLASLASRKWHKMVKHEKKCTQCKLHFKTSNEFCKHMQRHHAYCAECNMHFKSWYARISHMRFSIVHGDKRKRYKCDDCGMTFLMDSQLYRHMIMKHKKSEQK